MHSGRRLWLTLAFAGAGAGVLVAAAAPDAAALRCTREYNPVCGVDSKGVRTTQPNACMAKAANVRVLHPGECYGPICTMMYDPVCARTAGGGRRTFPSLCEASNANATLIRKGEC